MARRPGTVEAGGPPSPGVGADVVYGSAVSWVEIAIKLATRRLVSRRAWGPAGRATRFVALDFTTAHAERLGELPPVHKDPFDRMLVAQALAEGLTLVTRDAVLAGYGVPILAA